MSISEFRANTAAVLTRVENGEAVEIQRHGKTVARIVPVDAEKAVPHWKKPRAKVVMQGRPLSDTILKDRR